MSVPAPVRAPDPAAPGRTPPGPRGLPLLGVVPDIFRHHGLLRTLLHFWQVYGDAIQTHLGLYATVFFARPSAVQHVLVDNRDNYVRAQQFIQAGAKLLGNGLVTSEGAHWRRQRHFMQGPLAASAVPTYAPAMVAATRDLLADWDRRVAGGTSAAVEVDLLEEMAALTLDVLGRTIFGFDTRGDAHDVGQTFVEILDYLRRHQYGLIPSFGWLPLPDNRRLERNVRHLHDLLEHMIQVRRAKPDTYAYDTDLLSVMLRARDEWGEGMLERHLRDELMTLYLAGHQTSAELVTWVFYALANDPAIEATLHAELAAVLDGRPPTVADVEHLPYTRLVIDEALRLYPPAPLITKNARAPDVVDGFRVPAGALVVLSPYVTQRHPAVWPDPDRFDPLRHTPTGAAGRHRFAFFPFSAGYHSCIGASFAMLEAPLVVATIASRYRLHRLPGPSIEPSVTSTLAPRGLHMRLEPRAGISA